MTCSHPPSYTHTEHHYSNRGILSSKLAHRLLLSQEMFTTIFVFPCHLIFQLGICMWQTETQKNKQNCILLRYHMIISVSSITFKTKRWLRLRRLLCLQRVTTLRPKSGFWGIFNPTVTLTFDLLTPKFDTFILAPKSISGERLFSEWVSRV